MIEKSHCYGDEHWIQTFTGRKFWPLDPKPEDVFIEDIAHSLSLTCRFGGHVKEFYSVAQHSVLVSECCMSQKKWGLLHDAAEAYLADICKPIKPYMNGFADFEEDVLIAVSERFGLTYPIPTSVHLRDLQMLATEQAHLMDAGLDWVGLGSVCPIENLNIEPWHSSSAEMSFLSAFERLFGRAEDVENCLSDVL